MHKLVYLIYLLYLLFDKAEIIQSFGEEGYAERVTLRHCKPPLGRGGAKRQIFRVIRKQTAYRYCSERLKRHDVRVYAPALTDGVSSQTLGKGESIIVNRSGVPVTDTVI